ncbi:hypothetical protein ELS83_12350 [Marinifilum sp. JC070]|uniref:Uncharacterized protein n=2 Tax=Marinifilum caeruleilacunae TaxID=2499076 RepID=A0ABX1WWX1_9BACT|nr:hypothetical protein [Marinifilum caeruleilacunae]
MNEIYSLLQHDVLFSPDEMLSLLDTISDLNLFESSDLYQLLDEFKIKASGELVERIQTFNRSTLNVDLRIPDIRELMLN